MPHGSHILQSRETPEISARIQRVVDLLRERPMTITELATALAIEKATARSYVSEASKYAPVMATGVWGQTMYSVPIGAVC
jgi:response regulator of citrate/malate metabolism